MNGARVEVQNFAEMNKWFPENAKNSKMQLEKKLLLVTLRVVRRMSWFKSVNIANHGVTEIL